MKARQLPGTVLLFGTPAEETVVGKVYMARDQVFDEADAVLEWHPGLTTEVRNQPGRAMTDFTVEFFGRQRTPLRIHGMGVASWTPSSLRTLA